MKKKSLTILLPLATLGIASAIPMCRVQGDSGEAASGSADSAPASDVTETAAVTDSIPEADRAIRYERLSEEDYQEVAEELGIEVAAIKAVVEIEAGPGQKGFWQPGKPIINFDLSIYRKYAPMHGVNLTDARKQAPLIFKSPDRKRYGSQQAAQYARLDAAIAINRPSALESAFWGMFQIGGFNYNLCGCESVEEFVDMMSYSERAQLELFARYCEARNLTRFIRSKDWASFALRYNGKSYKSRRYDSRLATAYRKFSK